MIEFEKRAMIEAEDKYTFRQSSQISGQTGLIGYLRADMDTDGNGFFSSWNDWRKDLKTDEFKAEFDEVINSLREEGDILHNRKSLASYCYSTPQSKMQTEQDYYGVRVDTEKYAYLLRLNPNKGEYNLYCYCYVKDWLDGHMREAQRGIRFIDSHYKELFRIPDGGKIKIHYSWNEDQVRTCRYIDDYHVEVGDNVNNAYKIKPVVRLLKHWNIQKNYRDMASFELEKKIAENMMYSYISCTSYTEYLKKALETIKYSTSITRVNSAIDCINNALDYENDNMPYTALSEIKKAFPEI